ncbi:MAG: hypothetical protein LC109_09160 [Bacteroidia bacterium]|nr:hypothetical protein [Bacteroidia bacterium]MCO5253246.1 hypothetical protein [Bacteroidota bacterium]MCZ2130420.1 hypothetical protein [Bacteroidia bacterium]
MRKIAIPQIWATICLINLLIASLLGLLMRYILNYPIPFLNFEFILHSHSHFVFYAWATMALSTSLVTYLLPDDKKNKTSYAWIFWILFFSSYGMLITFIIQGYKVPSIVFSSIATFVFYWFAVIFIKDMRKSDNTSLVKYFSYIAVISFVISSLGPYFLAYFSATGQTAPLYINGALYFYLHFQYDGWFTFAVFALFLHWLVRNKIIFDSSIFFKFFALLAFSIFPGYALSIIGLTDAYWVNFAAQISIIAQLIAMVLFIQFFIQSRKKIAAHLQGLTKILWMTAFVSFVAKTIMQSFSIEPEITAFAFSYRPVAIGFLHLIFLCIISFFIFGFFFEKNLFQVNRNVLSKSGVILFVASTLLSEAILFLESAGAFFSIAMPNFNLWLLYITAVLSASLILFLIGQIKS